MDMHIYPYPRASKVVLRHVWLSKEGDLLLLNLVEQIKHFDMWENENTACYKNSAVAQHSIFIFELRVLSSNK